MNREKELLNVAVLNVAVPPGPSIDTGNDDSGEIQSESHAEIRKVMAQRVKTGEIFGSNWKQHLGFFMPFGTENCFWKRLKASSTFRYLFEYDHDCVTTLNALRSKSLTKEVTSARITVHDVDATVNNCALICALLLGVPMSVISDFAGGNQDGFIDWMRALHFGYRKGSSKDYICEPIDEAGGIYSDLCLDNFEITFMDFFAWTTISFYAALFTLMTAVVYYMCRPSESCNNTSLTVLLEACTLEVRKKIRDGKRKAGEEVIAPTVPFDSWGEETEVFLKAKFMAKAEAEEQLNQEFYMWYKSKMLLNSFCAFMLLLALPSNYLTTTSPSLLSLRISYFQSDNFFFALQKEEFWSLECF